MKDAKINRNNKSSIFAKLFGEKEKLLELYNAIENTNYGSDTDIRITTLENVLSKGKVNDISFVIDGKLVVLIEHQSTINENMPLRMYSYSAKVYDKIVPSETSYNPKRIPIPKPEFIVLYNGVDKFPDHETYRLSDMFVEPNVEGLGKLELEVEVYNINEGRNAEMVKRSEALKGYSFFISLLREYNKTMEIGAAAERAVKECLRQNVLKEFLEEHGSEIVNMLDWDDDDAAEYYRKEGRVEGIAIGEAKAAKAMLAKGMSDALIAEITGLGKDEIEGLR
jgi:hypothetical protein